MEAQYNLDKEKRTHSQTVEIRHMRLLSTADSVCAFAGLNICLLEAHLTPRSAWQCFVWFKSFAATRWFSCHDAVGPSLAIGRGEMPVVCIGTVLGNRRMCVRTPHVGVNRISSSPTLVLIQRRRDYASGTSFSAKASFSESHVVFF